MKPFTLTRCHSKVIAIVATILSLTTSAWLNTGCSKKSGNVNETQGQQNSATEKQSTASNVTNRDSNDSNRNPNDRPGMPSTIALKDETRPSSSQQSSLNETHVTINQKNSPPPDTTIAVTGATPMAPGAVSTSLAVGKQGNTGSNITPNVASKNEANLAPKTVKEAQKKPILEVLPQCFTEVFSHQKLASHSSEDQCAEHTNSIRISQNLAEINPKNLCVRVDGKAVKSKLDLGHNSLTIGPVAGPESKISIRYCLGQAKCQDNCEIAKDEFLGSLGADTDDEDTQDLQGLGDKSNPLHQKLSPEVKQALAKLDSQDTFKGWKTEAKPEAAKGCETKTVAVDTK